MLKSGPALAAIVVGALLALALPAVAHSDPGSQTAELAPVAPHPDGGDDCCHSNLGSHGQCHATAALVESPLLDPQPWGSAPIAARRVTFHTPDLPPPLKPPIASA